MQSRKLGAVVAVVGVVVAVVLFVVLSGGDDSDSGGNATETTAAGTAAGGGSDDGGSNAGQGGDPQGSGGASQGSGGNTQGSGGNQPAVPTIVVRGGQPVGGVQELTFSKGEEIRFAVESDVADHVHLHGYDVMEDVPAGGRVEFDVPATIDGVFEVELEDRVVQLAEITVEP